MGYSLSSVMTYDPRTGGVRRKTPQELADEGLDANGSPLTTAAATPAAANPPALNFGASDGGGQDWATLNADGTMSGGGSLDTPSTPVGDVYRDANGVYRGSGQPQQQISYSGVGGTPPSGGANWPSLYAPGGGGGYTPGGGSTGTVATGVGGGSPVARGGGQVSSFGTIPSPVSTTNRDALQTPAQVAGAAPEPYTPSSIPDYFFQRLRAILERPGDIASDPAFQFIIDQGTQALGRSAGAKRMRYAGKTLSDFQDFGQRAASQYYTGIADQNRQAAQNELSQWAAETNAGFTRSGQQQDAWRTLLGSETATYGARLQDALLRDRQTPITSVVANMSTNPGVPYFRSQFDIS